MFPDPPSQDSAKIRLHTVFEKSNVKGNAIYYTNDFGDGWEHVVTATGTAEATTHFVCLGGEGHGCAEDVGGIMAGINFWRHTMQRIPPKIKRKS